MKLNARSHSVRPVSYTHLVPDDLLAEYRNAMEAAFGAGACYVLNVRNYGAVEVTDAL